MLQCLPDTVQEEGVLLHIMLFQILLELLEQFLGHLKGHRPLLSIHFSVPSIFVVVCEKLCHEFAQGFSGLHLLLSDACVQGDRDLRT